MVEIAAIAVLLMLCCALFVVLLMQRQAKDSATTGAWRQGHEHGVSQAKAAATQITQRLAAYEQLLRGHQGGVGTHLADTREVAELIRSRAPGLLKETDGLARLLHGHDDFLGQLLDVYVTAEQDANGAQSRAAARWPAGIYGDVFEAAGVPAPGALIGKHFVIALEAGIVVIRGTGLYGCIGKINLARRDLERFFNDLVAKPRSLAEDRDAKVPCRGLYRIDIPADPRAEQLVVEVASPSSGHVYLGAPQQEMEALHELKTLKRAVQKLLEDEAKGATRKAAAQRARILRRDALLGHVPDNGICAACDGDVTMRLKLGDKPTGCPLCGTPWSD